MQGTLLLAADHRGHEMKEEVERHATSRGVQVVDLTPDLVPGDDYPEIAAKLVAAMRESGEGARGVLACGSGIGIAVAANRFRGVRAALGMSPGHVQAARHDDDVNVLVLAADFTSPADVRAMVDTFLAEPFGDEDRYGRRRAQLDQLGP